jgi:hypothetical protein
VATPNGLSGSCGNGTVTAAAGSGTVSLSGLTVAPSMSCTFSINVTGITAGMKNDSVTLTFAERGVNTSAASLSVVAPPTIATSFAVQTLVLGGTTTVTFSLANRMRTLRSRTLALPISCPQDWR